MDAEELFEALPALCCGCWILPLVVITAVGLVSQALSAGWKNRGLERGRLYCANCRFDLRGGSGLTCPECGNTLNASGITVGDDNPPPGAGYQILLVMALSTAPIIAAVIVVLSVLPFNYVRTDRVSMDDRYVHVPQVNRLDIYISASRGRWFKNLDELEIQMYGRDSSVGWSMRPDADPEKVFSPEVFAQRTAELGVEFDPPGMEERFRTQLVLLLRMLIEDQGKAIELAPGPMAVSYSSDNDFSPHPLVVLLFAGLGCWLWGYLLVRTLRSNTNAFEQYHEKQRAVAERYRRQVVGVVE